MSLHKQVREEPERGRERQHHGERIVNDHPPPSPRQHRHDENEEDVMPSPLRRMMVPPAARPRAENIPALPQQADAFARPRPTRGFTYRRVASLSFLFCFLLWIAVQKIRLEGVYGRCMTSEIYLHFLVGAESWRGDHLHLLRIEAKCRLLAAEPKKAGSPGGAPGDSVRTVVWSKRGDKSHQFVLNAPAEEFFHFNDAIYFVVEDYNGNFQEIIQEIAVTADHNGNGNFLDDFVRFSAEHYLGIFNFLLTLGLIFGAFALARKERNPCLVLRGILGFVNEHALKAVLNVELDVVQLVRQDEIGSVSAGQHLHTKFVQLVVLQHPSPSRSSPLVLTGAHHGRLLWPEEISLGDINMGKKPNIVPGMADRDCERRSRGSACGTRCSYGEGRRGSLFKLNPFHHKDISCCYTTSQAVAW